MIKKLIWNLVGSILAELVTAFEQLKVNHTGDQGAVSNTAPKSQSSTDENPSGM